MGSGGVKERGLGQAGLSVRGPDVLLQPCLAQSLTDVTRAGEERASLLELCPLCFPRRFADLVQGDTEHRHPYPRILELISSWGGV